MQVAQEWIHFHTLLAIATHAVRPAMVEKCDYLTTLFSPPLGGELEYTIKQPSNPTSCEKMGCSTGSTPFLDAQRKWRNQCLPITWPAWPPKAWWPSVPPPQRFHRHRRPGPSCRRGTRSANYPPWVRCFCQLQYKHDIPPVRRFGKDFPGSHVCRRVIENGRKWQKADLFVLPRNGHVSRCHQLRSSHAMPLIPIQDLHNDRREGDCRGHLGTRSWRELNRTHPWSSMITHNLSDEVMKVENVEA